MTIRYARLTRPAIRALKAGEKINEHGISAEKLANGDVRYSLCSGPTSARADIALTWEGHSRER